MKRVLFVCLGNICRSPAAEEVARSIATECNLANRFEFDSAGTYGGHSGQLPDPRMRAHARRRGYDLNHRARRLTPSDFDYFDLIVAMDDANYHDLRDIAPTLEAQEKVVKRIDFCRSHPYDDCVPDPYYEGAEGFEHVLDLLEDACHGLIQALQDSDYTSK